MSDWSSFNEDKKRADAWKKYLTERDTGKYNFGQTATQQTKRKGTPPKGRVLLSNVLVSLEKDGLVSADQAGKIHDLIRKKVVAKHGRQFFDQTMGENVNLAAYTMPISKPQRRGLATKQRRLDSIDLTSVGISKVFKTGRPALNIVANCLQKTNISFALTPVPNEKEVLSFFFSIFFFFDWTSFVIIIFCSLSL